MFIFIQFTYLSSLSQHEMTNVFLCTLPSSYSTLAPGLCPERASKDGLPKTSTVETLSDPIPDLFEVLTEEEDYLLRWTTYTYPAHLDLLSFQPRGTDLEHGLEETITTADGMQPGLT